MNDLSLNEHISANVEAFWKFIRDLLRSICLAMLAF